jgi:hypothetical protein
MRRTGLTKEKHEIKINISIEEVKVENVYISRMSASTLIYEVVLFILSLTHSTSLISSFPRDLLRHVLKAHIATTAKCS